MVEIISDESAEWTILKTQPGEFVLGGVLDNSRDVYVRAMIGSDGKPFLTSLTITGSNLTSIDLRRLPLRKIQAVLDTPMYRAHMVTA